MTISAAACPDKNSDNPLSFFYDQTFYEHIPLRRSASMNKTFFPVIAIVAAKLLLIKVLPAPD